jgi:hypothetical protein
MFGMTPTAIRSAHAVDLIECFMLARFRKEPRFAFVGRACAFTFRQG